MRAQDGAKLRGISALIRVGLERLVVKGAPDRGCARSRFESEHRPSRARFTPGCVGGSARLRARWRRWRLPAQDALPGAGPVRVHDDEVAAGHTLGFGQCSLRGARAAVRCIRLAERRVTGRAGPPCSPEEAAALRGGDGADGGGELGHGGGGRRVARGGVRGSILGRADRLSGADLAFGKRPAAEPSVHPRIDPPHLSTNPAESIRCAKILNLPAPFFRKT
jgi:hypothetical protein